MGWLTRRMEVQLDILESLARSQRALARIIESAAEAGAASGLSAESLERNIEAMTRYQLAIMEKITGVELPAVKTSPPAPPWTNNAIGVAAGRPFPVSANQADS